MPEFTGEETEFIGQLGHAERLEVLDTPEFIATVTHWLVTQPHAHPAWSQYTLAGIRLAEYPSMSSPILQFPEATHELLVTALSPKAGEQTVESMSTYADKTHPNFGKLPYLSPINIAWQFQGTDDECNKLVSASAWGIVNGILPPETSDAPEAIRTYWADTLSRTLHYLRGQPH